MSSESKTNQTTTIFLILFMFLNVAVSAAVLAFAVIATEQRKLAKRERSEIICILKILPEDRQSNPGAVDACGK